ncbi:hypothetical protein ALMP_34860, partial [Streptomyces sp. A012304]
PPAHPREALRMTTLPHPSTSHTARPATTPNPSEKPPA